MTITFQITGLKDLERALGGDIQKAARIAGVAVTSQVKQAIAPYPAAGAGNRPNGAWYERGFGPKWHSTPGRRWPDYGRATKRNVVYGGGWAGVKTSETLSKSWGVKRHRLGGEVGSKATYAPVVHHYKEQAKFHGRRGWVTDKAAVAKVQKSGVVDKIVKRAVDRILKGKRK